MPVWTLRPAGPRLGEEQTSLTGTGRTMDDRHDDRHESRAESATGTPGSAMPGPDPVLARLDRLSELLMRRIDRLEERVRSLEQDNGEIINLLIAVKAGLEEASGDLIAQLEEGDGHVAGQVAGPEDGPGDDQEDGPLFKVPCGPMLH
ncbi:hypothetical protein ABMY26_26785 [Azospirillum sp. HJ39]|uniref:hypothetical protein n=1 Tax=Azospirillum sp. HJ39 TaxID=3159496 RepID=UPI0035588D2D